MRAPSASVDCGGAWATMSKRSLSSRLGPPQTLSASTPQAVRMRSTIVARTSVASNAGGGVCAKAMAAGRLAIGKSSCGNGKATIRFPDPVQDRVDGSLVAGAYVQHHVVEIAVRPFLVVILADEGGAVAIHRWQQILGFALRLPHSITRLIFSS